MGVKTPPKLFAFILVSQLCLFVQQNMQACTKLTILKFKKCKNFLGRGHPSPDLTPLSASIFAPMALKLNVTPPEKT